MMSEQGSHRARRWEGKMERKENAKPSAALAGVSIPKHQRSAVHGPSHHSPITAPDDSDQPWRKKVRRAPQVGLNRSGQ
ncbi:hypothetical protein GGTG_10776 [Gaeumannomyces tritici R3-111a-1]|uniref:Uncharacterized protein n=1 Tax=Gaeumannomyces tritici (strain R3-111a-1) TaxID=644352 RepID=J3PBA3_GAET3|nr:hypothetical protein GGTG_10776 [Gaeumannomyces tritici R3-111a-1]EJT71519.1 hypothetical protein GGTG_10776 [Gaeumannomyces tritici R3-111a-1]